MCTSREPSTLSFNSIELQLPLKGWLNILRGLKRSNTFQRSSTTLEGEVDISVGSTFRCNTRAYITKSTGDSGKASGKRLFMLSRQTVIYPEALQLHFRLKRPRSHTVTLAVAWLVPIY